MSSKCEVYYFAYWDVKVHIWCTTFDMKIIDTIKYKVVQG